MLLLATDFPLPPTPPDTRSLWLPSVDTGGVSFATPRLWNHIYIPGTKTSVLRGVTTHLEQADRAAHVPIYLTIDLRDRDFLAAACTGFFFAGILRGMESKVKGLELVSEKAWPPQVITKGLRQFSGLDRLFLGRGFTFTGPPDSSMWGRLTHIHVQYPNTRESFGKLVVTLPLPQLESLIIEAEVGQTLPHQLLSNFPNLVELLLSAEVIYVDFNNVITHRKLERVGIWTDVENPTVYPFFKLCSLPSLKDLALRPPRGSQYLRGVIPPFLERSGCRLDRLTVNSCERRHKSESRAIQERFSIPAVEVGEDMPLAQMIMFRESKSRWYERGSVDGWAEY